jgi:adenine/guanine/hypoxanthine permease
MTMLVMPLTWSISNGIGAGFIAHVVIKLVRGKGGQVHPLLYLAALAFVVYFVVASHG